MVMVMTVMAVDLHLYSSYGMGRFGVNVFVRLGR